VRLDTVDFDLLPYASLPGLPRLAAWNQSSRRSGLGFTES
jgi:hypothetical protein